MPSKTPGILSGILTVILLSITALFISFGQIIVLNGATERQGGTAIGISLACQGLTTILLGFFVGWVTNFLITKRNWNKIAAVILPVLIGTTLGLFVSLLSAFISIPIAGIR